MRSNLTAFQTLMAALGPDWGSIMTDVTRGKAGNNERMAFVFDHRRARPSGLAGELVVSIEEGASVNLTGLDKQFARTPYAVSFEVGRLQLTLVTLHVLYGKEEARVTELREIAAWLARWAKEERHWNENVIALGDFNVDRRGDPLYDALTSTGLEPAPQLNEAPRTIFGDSGTQKFYDQIAWFADPKKGPALSLTATAAWFFDFVPLLKGDLTKTALSWRISDHYPLWVEFSVR